MAGIIKNIDGHPNEIGGTANHIHILSTLPKTMAPSKFINQIKRNSSKWIKGIDQTYSGFSWQSGYGIFSVSSSKLETVQKYIQNQESHHKRLTYQEEVVQFLKEYGVDYDEKYLWD